MHTKSACKFLECTKSLLAIRQLLTERSNYNYITIRPRAYVESKSNLRRIYVESQCLSCDNRPLFDNYLLLYNLYHSRSYGAFVLVGEERTPDLRPLRRCYV